MENSIQYGKKHYASAVTQGLEVKIYLVNTEELKKDHNSFTEGGHHIAREDLRFIPEGEIWVDNSFRNDVLVGILLHEVNEYGRMNKLGEDYETAHENSEKIETDWRNTGFSPLGETNIFFKHFTETHSISLPFEAKEINEEYFKQIHGIYESSKLISVNYMPVDNDDRIILYHSSLSGIDEIREGAVINELGIHLGSLETAEKINSIKGGSIRKYEVSINNPIEIKDFFRWEAFVVSRELKNIGILSNEEYEAVNKRTGNEKERELIKILKEKGYDGFKYENAIEGGGASYVVFDKSQIREIQVMANGGEIVFYDKNSWFFDNTYQGEYVKKHGFVPANEAMPTVTENDYYVSTEGTFERSNEKEYENIDTKKFVSDSGSSYKIKDGTIYRKSNHWGDVGTCNWHYPYLKYKGNGTVFIREDGSEAWLGHGYNPITYGKIKISDLKRTGNALVKPKSETKLMANGGIVNDEITENKLKRTIIRDKIKKLEILRDFGRHREENKDRINKEIAVLNKVLKYIPDKEKMEYGGEILLSPNGKPSNLTLEQYRLVRTPEFKAWFGDWENEPENASKVVDENGEPLVVYHGSGASFNIFDKNKFNLNEKAGDYVGEGFYFTNEKSKAGKYGNFINAFFLNSKKPIAINIKGDFDLIRDDLFGYEKYGEVKVPYYFKLRKDSPELIREKIIESGFDGLIDNLYHQYAVFEPNQIKLADGTNTTFDINNPDIRYKEGGSFPAEDEVDRIYEKAIERFKKEGYEIEIGGDSKTDYGHSAYFYINNGKLQVNHGLGFKVRVSNHSVENIDRMLDEIHIRSEKDIAFAVHKSRELVEKKVKAYEENERKQSKEREREEKWEADYGEKYRKFGQYLDQNNLEVKHNDRTYQDISEFNAKHPKAQYIMLTIEPGSAYSYDWVEPANGYGEKLKKRHFEYIVKNFKLPNE